MIPLYKVYMRGTVGQAVDDTLNSGYIGEGERVAEFERCFEEWLRPENGFRVLATNSCTSALHLAVHLIRNKGSEVLTTSLTCMAAVSAIVNNGLTVRWVDVDSTGNIELTDLERKLSDKTAAVLVNHYGGYPAPVEKVQGILQEHNPAAWTIEDCAQAIGSRYRKQRVGSNGLPRTIKCFSFQATKPLTTGDGGAIVVPPDMYERVKRLRWYGLDRNQNRFTQIVPEVGFKFHMNDIAATIGIENIQQLEYVLLTQQTNRKKLVEELVGCQGLGTLHDSDPDRTTVSSCLMVWVKRRWHFERAMKSRGVEVSPVHAACHRYACVQDAYTHLPNTDWMTEDVVALPCGWWVGHQAVEQIVDSVKQGW